MKHFKFQGFEIMFSGSLIFFQTIALIYVIISKQIFYLFISISGDCTDNAQTCTAWFFKICMWYPDICLATLPVPH